MDGGAKAEDDLPHRRVAPLPPLEPRAAPDPAAADVTAGDGDARAQAAWGARPSLLARRRGRASAPLTLCAVGRGLGRAGAEAGDAEGAAACCRLEDRYVLLGAVGQGAHGVVFEAMSRQSGERVALKHLRVHDEELVANARREFAILSAVRHPHIIRAQEIFEHATGVAIAMEFFPGRTLQAAVDAAGAPDFIGRHSLGVLRPLAEAVDHLHRHGIVHRDVTTRNVLVCGDLRDVRLVDFGIAHRRGTDGELLDMHGSLEFLAPEALMGQSAGEPCDVWGLGLCLHTMLRGGLPVPTGRFPGRAAYCAAVRGALAAAPAAGGAAGRLLERCLDQDPASRATAAEAAALAQAGG